MSTYHSVRVEVGKIKAHSYSSQADWSTNVTPHGFSRETTSFPRISLPARKSGYTAVLNISADPESIAYS